MGKDKDTGPFSDLMDLGLRLHWAVSVGLAVLAKAFRGESVPQDPNDEPAEKLLERIRKERADEGASMGMHGRAKRAPRKQGGRRSHALSA